MHKVVVYSEQKAMEEQAKSIAERLGLSFSGAVEPSQFCLHLLDTGLELCLIETIDKIPSGISVDFASGPMKQLVKSAKKSQPLGRAIGSAQTVFDATAGLGKDALFLVALRYHVIACERSPVIFELLEDGYKRALSDTLVGPLLKERLRIVNGNSIDYLEQLRDGELPDVVYLDPMYPESKKSALPKKEMQIFRRFMDDTGGDDMKLFEVASRKALKRVVVKRPIAAPPLVEPVSMTFAGKMARYDSYLKRR